MLTMRSRLLLLTATALVLVLVVGGMGLQSLRKGLEEERRDSITHLLLMSTSMLNRYQQKVVDGQLSLEQAQNEAKQTLSALNYNDESFYWVRLENGLNLVHRDPAAVNTMRQATLTDGRSDTEAYKQEMAAAPDGIGFTYLEARDPTTGIPVPKLNGVIEFAPWGWWVGTGSFTRDINASFWRSALKVVVALVITLLVLGGMAWMTLRGMMRVLGGEPAEVAGVAARIAAGDLSIECKVGAKSSRSLSASIELMRQELAKLVGEIRQGAEAISTGSAEIARGGQSLSSVTEQQAASLEETAASMEQLTGTVQRNAENARHASQMASEAREGMGEGNQAVQQMVGTMRGIATDSQRIAEITQLIDGIAFQTNLLALNASVEAARAGEQGRGFAVVAEEVRNLAGRSTAAAKQIEILIKASSERVTLGTQQVDEAGESMQSLEASIERVSSLMGEIAQASSEQSDGIDQVNTAVAQLDSTTQQNAAMVEQSAASADALAEQAQRLLGLVSRFRLQMDDSTVALPGRTG